MDRRQFLVRVVTTGAAAVGVAALNGSPALASTKSGSARTQPSTAQFLLGTGRRALA